MDDVQWRGLTKLTVHRPCSMLAFYFLHWYVGGWVDLAA